MNNQTITDQDTVDTWPEAEDWSRWEQPLRERVLNWLRWRVFVAELLARWAFRWEHSRRLGTIGGVEIQLHNVWLFFTPFRCPIDERDRAAQATGLALRQISAFRRVPPPFTRSVDYFARTEARR